MENAERGADNPPLLIRVYLSDGSIQLFAINKQADADQFWEKLEPSRLFGQARVVVAGTRSKSVFNTCHVNRVDFARDSNDCWTFPAGASDIVELSEEEFRKHARLDRPDQMVRREEPTPVGDLLVSFLKLHLAGGQTVFVMVELPMKLPIENQSFMQFLLSKAAFHMRLRGGGVGFVNLANLLGYTVYPGVAQVPTDSWLAEPLNF
jgi:hypothetical protein